MPLRDHFRPPVTDFASWEELHGAWPSTIAYRPGDAFQRRSSGRRDDPAFQR